ncbi:MAG: non-canonical purine NTP pyrophosphatase [Alphaproteobacteria bacterium]
MKITVVTGNVGKIASFRRCLEPLGFDVAHENIDLIEPQLDSIEEVALSKARQAHAALKRPLIVEDTGFYVEALNDFPGPYNKYVIGKVGVKGYLALMDGETNRNCRFFSALVYIDAGGKEHVFTSETKGTLALEPDKTPLRSDAKSTLWQLYIPDGFDKTLNELNGAERQAFRKLSEDTSVAAIFAKWLAAQEQPQPLNKLPVKKPRP